MIKKLLEQNKSFEEKSATETVEQKEADPEEAPMKAAETEEWKNILS